MSFGAEYAAAGKSRVEGLCVVSFHLSTGILQSGVCEALEYTNEEQLLMYYLGEFVLY